MIRDGTMQRMNHASHSGYLFSSARTRLEHKEFGLSSYALQTGTRPETPESGPTILRHVAHNRR